MSNTWLEWVTEPIKKCLPVISSACCNTTQHRGGAVEKNVSDGEEIDPGEEIPPKSKAVHFNQNSQQSQHIGTFVHH